MSSPVYHQIPAGAGMCCSRHSFLVWLLCCSFKQYTKVVFAEKMMLLTGFLQRSISSQTPVDLHDLMYRFTLDSFGTIGFGVDPGSLTSEKKVAFAAAFDEAQVVSGSHQLATLEAELMPPDDRLISSVINEAVLLLQARPISDRQPDK